MGKILNASKDSLVDQLFDAVADHWLSAGFLGTVVAGFLAAWQ